MNLSNQIIKEKLLDDSSVLKSNSQETLNQNKDNNFVDEPSLDVTRKVSFQLSFEEKNLDKNAPVVPKKEKNLINQELLDGLSNKELKEIISHIQLRRDSPALINIDQMASVLNDASPELAAEILRGIDWAHASQIIAKIRDRTAVGNLYRLSPGAEGLMKAEVVGMRSEWPISHALSVLRKSGLKSADLQNLFVVDKGGLLLGSIDLPDLVFSDPRKHVRDVMSINVVSVELGTDREHCARLMETHGLRAIPVVNKSGILQGVISIEELVQVAEDEATEDMFKMVGMSIQDRVIGPLKSSFKRRLPWLAINLGTVLLAGFVLSLFSSSLTRFSVLAIFLPVVMGQAGIAGTQTLTLVVRSLALGDITTRDTRKILIREGILALIQGFCVTILLFGVVLLWKSELFLALLVAIAMLLNLFVAAIGGVLVPILMKYFKMDPASSSAVVVTTMTDIAGIVLYLGLANLMVSYI